MLGTQQIAPSISIYMVRYFASWQEQNRAEVVQNVPPRDARRKIIYQLGQRLADPPVKKEYGMIPLSTDADQ